MAISSCKHCRGSINKTKEILSYVERISLIL